VQEKRNKTTEEVSLYRHLEKMPVKDILSNINKEDRKSTRGGNQSHSPDYITG